MHTSRSYFQVHIHQSQSSGTMFIVSDAGQTWFGRIEFLLFKNYKTGQLG